MTVRGGWAGAAPAARMTVAMELIADSTEQIYVRPLPTASPDVVRSAKLTTAFVPAMTVCRGSL